MDSQTVVFLRALLNMNRAQRRVLALWLAWLRLADRFHLPEGQGVFLLAYRMTAKREYVLLAAGCLMLVTRVLLI